MTDQPPDAPPADVADEPAVVASTPPVGVSSRQIFAIALILLGFYAIAGIGVIAKGDAAERTAFEQSAINLALLAAGYYLGSSAGSRNKELRR